MWTFGHAGARPPRVAAVADASNRVVEAGAASTEPESVREPRVERLLHRPRPRGIRVVGVKREHAAQRDEAPCRAGLGGEVSPPCAIDHDGDAGEHSGEHARCDASAFAVARTADVPVEGPKRGRKRPDALLGARIERGAGDDETQVASKPLRGECSGASGSGEVGAHALLAPRSGLVTHAQPFVHDVERCLACDGLDTAECPRSDLSPRARVPPQLE